MRFEKLESRRLLSAGIVSDIADRFPRNLTPAGTELYFTSSSPYESQFDSGFTQLSLARSDGTIAGTRLLLDQISAEQITPLGNKVLFVATNGFEQSLYAYDRTTATSELIVTFRGISDLTAVGGGTAYFVAGGIDTDSLWRTDGTIAGTKHLHSPDSAGMTGIQSLTDVNGTLYFVASSRFQGEQYQSKYTFTTTGTDASTRRINPSTQADHLTVAGKHFFCVDDFYSDSSQELSDVFKTDGPIKDINPGNNSSHPAFLTALGSQVLFVADDGELGGTGDKWWISDGTEAGTVILRDAKTSGIAFGDRAFDDLGEHGNRVLKNIVIVGKIAYFLAGNEENHLWRTDGTAAGTYEVGLKFHIDAIAARSDGMLYLAVPGEPLTSRQDVVYVCDPATKSLQPVITDLTFGSYYDTDPQLTVVNDKAFVSGYSGHEGDSKSAQLWAYDPNAGAIAGTVFDDVNSNGARDNGEDPLRGYKVFIDRNNDGICNKNEQWTRASKTGRFRFDLLPAGSYRIRVVGVEGRRASTPQTFVLKVTPDATVTRYFGRTDKILVAGIVYMDANKNGTIDAGESGMGGWTVFADADHDGTLDAGELSAITDDAGRFVFDRLTPGSWQIRVIAQSRYRLTSPGAGSRTISLPAGGVASKANFGEKRIA